MSFDVTDYTSSVRINQFMENDKAKPILSGINLNKLESRPIPERDFEFAFYFDLDTSIYSPAFLQLMAELPGICEQFSYLGSYSEVI